MKVFIYWNRKDSDSTKIYGFLKNGSWIKDLEDKHSVVKAFIFNRFDVNTLIITGYNGKEMTLLEAMQQSDILFFFSHGDDDRIFKSKFYNASSFQEFTYMDCENASMASCKAIVSICCSSAKVLGQHCVKNEGVPYYIGFEEPIVYDDNACPNDKLRSVMFKAYSKGFNIGFEGALINGYTAEKMVKYLKLCINQSITQEILDSNERSLKKYSGGTQFYIKGIESLVCIGDSKSQVFKSDDGEAC